MASPANLPGSVPATTQFVSVGPDDFIPLPAKSITFNGVRLSRSTLIRAIAAEEIKSRLFCVKGSTKGRRYVLRESLEEFVRSSMLDVPL